MNSVPTDLMIAFDNLSLRMDQCIVIPLAIDSDEPSDALREFIEEGFPENPNDPLFVQWPAAAVFKDAGYAPGIDEFIESIFDYGNDLGFLIQVARPVMEYDRIRLGATYSWGFYNTKWLYGSTLSEAIECAVSWGHRIDAIERADASKGGAA